MTDALRLADERTKKSGESVTYEIPWWKYTGRVWRSGERFIATAYVRPTRPNGYEYECTVAGQTAAREPTNWPTTVGVTLIDGSVTWTCRAIGNNAVDTISGANSVWAAVTSGITITGALIDAIKQLTSARISGGTNGQDYTITNTITTVGGELYVYTLTIRVRD